MVGHSQQIDILIFGAGGHAKVASDCAREKYQRQVMLGEGHMESQWRGIQILSQSRNTLTQWKDICPRAFVAIGDGTRRETVTSALEKAGFSIMTLVHPSAAVSPSAQLGAGTLVCPNAVVNADAQIGRGCIINSGAIVEHECVVGNFSHISPGAALGGGVELGEHCWICLGASVADHIQIGRESVVGAGAAVLSSLPERVLAVGVPARIRKNKLESR